MTPRTADLPAQPPSWKASLSTTYDLDVSPPFFPPPGASFYYKTFKSLPLWHIASSFFLVSLRYSQSSVGRALFDHKVTLIPLTTTVFLHRGKSLQRASSFVSVS